ncbi:hypothetical protein NHQ30_007907 [Ciborinia camelliae]|nr:hypothetical protein NHQ30_007907 [Ciborinia camelliae]
MASDLPTVPILHRHTTSISDYNIATPATTDTSLRAASTVENPILHPRKFDLENDTELYIHENRVIPRLFFYEPEEDLQISRLKMMKEGYYVGHPRTLVFSVAGAVGPLKRNAPQELDFGFDFASSSSSKPDTEEIYRAAYSLHFGPKSRYNTTGKLEETGSKVEMQKIAELAAACEALEFVEAQCTKRIPGFEDVSGEIAPGGLVVGVTSSTNLWYGVTEHIVGFSSSSSIQAIELDIEVEITGQVGPVDQDAPSRHASNPIPSRIKLSSTSRVQN